MTSLRKFIRVLVGCLLVVALCGCSAKRSITTVDDTFMEKDVLFATAESAELRLDIVWPNGSGQYPALLFLFGNGWGYWSGGRAFCTQRIMDAGRRHYVAVAVDYRQTSEKKDGKVRYPFPAQVHDVKAAVRWLRAHASTYHIDARRIGAVGFSSGAHLALILGLTGPKDGLEGNLGNLRFPSKVQAVASCAGPTDFTQYFPNPESRAAIEAFLGGPPESNAETYAKASPVLYVSAGAPPILTIHGKKDDEIPVSQAYELDSRMKAAGAIHLLDVKPQLGHVDLANSSEVLDFMDKYLAK
jgi:acetyl esterase/lipase